MTAALLPLLATGLSAGHLVTELRRAAEALTSGSRFPCKVTVRATHYPSPNMLYLLHFMHGNTETYNSSAQHC